MKGGLVDGGGGSGGGGDGGGGSRAGGRTCLRLIVMCFSRLGLGAGLAFFLSSLTLALTLD